ncbi:MAG: NADH-quinone oxidoreductase subunit C [Anaerolineae bacterium]|nr:NADH-quinone oxidoreductase subunit C [Anaerolineae bacterium]MBL6965954.1 NADH-quinone oxidoreductase subunit C [Anaerolineales bacterium]
MDEKLKNAIQAIRKDYDVDKLTFRGEYSMLVSPENVVDICRQLRDDFGFNMLSSLTAVDYWPANEPRFHVVYQLYSTENNITLRLRVQVPGENPKIPTIEKLYPNANWHERELWDMFGIQVDGHSDLRRILMPADWEGHPLRKDYPLGYEEVQFSFNAEEIDKKKPYVKE